MPGARVLNEFATSFHTTTEETTPRDVPLHLVSGPPASDLDDAPGLAESEWTVSQSGSETSQDSSPRDPATAISQAFATRMPAHRRAHAQNLQLWEGTVVSAGEREFRAALRDLTDAHQPEENGCFALDEVAPDDVPLVRPGAVFYWHIGYSTEHGTRSLVSQLRFRRLPSWTPADVERVNRRAAEQYDALFQADDD